MEQPVVSRKPISLSPVILVALILTAIIAAGLVYVAESKKNRDSNTAAQSGNSSPEKVANQTGSHVSATPTAQNAGAPSASPVATAGSWKNYSNTALGFSLTFTDPWEGYTAVVNKDGSVGFSVPTVKPLDAGTNYTTDPTAEIFTISRFTTAQYNTSVSQGIPQGTVLLRTDKYVYERLRRLDAYPSNLKNKITESDIQAVLQSFKAL